MIIDKDGYLAYRPGNRKPPKHNKPMYKKWWLVKSNAQKVFKGGKKILADRGIIHLQKTLNFPASWVGKKVRFKLEVIDDDQI